jgi:hypothetical protein
MPYNTLCSLMAQNGCNFQKRGERKSKRVILVWCNPFCTNDLNERQIQLLTQQ